MFIRLSQIVHQDDCYEEDDRRHVESTIIRFESITSLSVGSGYVWIQLGDSHERVEINRSLWENSADYTNILMRRLTEISSAQ